MKMKLLSLVLALGLTFSAGVMAQDARDKAPTADAGMSAKDMAATNKMGANAQDEGTVPEGPEGSVAGYFFCTALKLAAPTLPTKDTACYKACYAGTTPDLTDLGPCVAWMDANQDAPGMTWIKKALTSLATSCNSTFRGPCTTLGCQLAAIEEACGTVCCNITGAANGVKNCLARGANSHKTCTDYPDNAGVPDAIKKQPW